MAAAIRTEVNAGYYRAIYDRIGDMHRGRLVGLLRSDRATRRSRFDDVKKPAGSARLSRFREHLTHVAWLGSLAGGSEDWMAGVPAAKVSNFAAEAKVTDAGDMKKMDPIKQVALVACLIHVSRTRGRDDLATMCI